jgi:hypothetical protein
MQRSAAAGPLRDCADQAPAISFRFIPYPLESTATRVACQIAVPDDARDASERVAATGGALFADDLEGKRILPIGKAQQIARNTRPAVR